MKEQILQKNEKKIFCLFIVIFFSNNFFIAIVNDGINIGFFFENLSIDHLLRVPLAD